MVSVRRLVFLIAVTAAGLLAPAAPAQIESLPRPDSLESASFGVSVAINDSIAVVGASGASVCGEDSGAVYVYRRRPGPMVTSWVLSARLVPSPCRTGAFFGADVALSGSRILVSAFNNESMAEGTNAAYIFQRRAVGSWRQTARLTGLPNQQEGFFAAGVALDGDRAVVSTSGDPEGAHGGAVYVFEADQNPREWDRTARLTASRGTEGGILGGDVALDGRILVVAASTYFAETPGYAYVFRRDADRGRWAEEAHLSGLDAFFIDVALDASTLIVGEDRARDDRSGVAGVYQRVSSSWTRTTTLRPSIPYESGAFGTSVAVDGRWALVTGYDEQLGQDVNIDRVVYVFRRGRVGTWRERTILDVGQVDFGAALDLNDGIALVSSVRDTETGTVYVARLP